MAVRNIKLGSSNIDNVMFGATEIQSVYKGETLLWEREKIHDYTKDYLTFTALSAGRINVHSTPAAYLLVRYNGGSWSALPMSDGTYDFITVKSGDVVEFKGNGSFVSGTSGTFATGNSSATYNVSGNIMSLVAPDNFAETTTLNTSFKVLFYSNTSLVSARNLMLPATTLAVSGAYLYMFRNCTNLIEGPTIGAINWESSQTAQACMYMFRGCSNLQYIKALCYGMPENIPPYNSNTFLLWTDGVASTGTFVKAKGMDWNSGDGGIPSGWTVEEVEL